MSALDKQAAKVIAALANLATVEKSLRFLASVGVVRDEAVVKGCRKFVKDHPEIQAWIDSDAFMTDMGANDLCNQRPATTDFQEGDKA